MTKAIYKFYRDYGRMGDIEGVFVADTDRVAKAMGKSVYLGEILGKHSDIEFTLSEDDLEFVTNDFSVVELFEKFDLSSGYNPIERIDEFDEDDNEDEDNEE